MGNSLVIYDESCLNSPFEELEKCPVNTHHCEIIRLITQFARVLEKSVYQNYDVLNSPEGTRISWYQLFGQCIKRTGQDFPESDPFRENTITAGRAEKLIGQMENEFATVCNSLILRPIQEARLYDKNTINPLTKLYNELYRRIKSDEVNSNIVPNTNQQYSEFKNVHKKLHDSIIQAYKMLSTVKNKLPAIIEFQLEMTNYSSSYLEYILHSYKSTKSLKHLIVPLKDVQTEMISDIPDYRKLLDTSAMNSVALDELERFPGNSFNSRENTKSNSKSQELNLEKSSKNKHAVVSQEEIIIGKNEDSFKDQDNLDSSKAQVSFADNDRGCFAKDKIKNKFKKSSRNDQNENFLKDKQCINLVDNKEVKGIS